MKKHINQCKQLIIFLSLSVNKNYKTGGGGGIQVVLSDLRFLV